MEKVRTLGALEKQGYRVLSVKEEMRQNLIAKLGHKENLFPGIVGYDQTVIPQIVNAILAGQDIIFLGERGQAKTRIIRSLVNFLDEEVPVVEGSEVNDNPFDPISMHGRQMVEEQGANTPIAWLPRSQRYGEKLATPDVTTADLIGEIDPIKVAEGRYLSDELVIHYGLIPRTNRGVFAINELPDLSEKIQVGLFNIMEERDLQIRGFKIRLPLDVYIVASANPEDYTNRGRIITPLKDRYGAEIRTHYPTAIDEEISIMETERKKFDNAPYRVTVPTFMKEIVAELTSILVDTQTGKLLPSMIAEANRTDLIAPGVCINSTWMLGGYNTISGTSMASPHVAGGAALYKATHPTATPAAVKSALQAAGWAVNRSGFACGSGVAAFGSSAG